MEIFNVSNTGSFSDVLSFTRAMTSTNALFTQGSVGIPVTIDTTTHLIRDGIIGLPDVIIYEGPIQGLFLHISSIDPYAYGTFTIMFDNGIDVFSFTYELSSLYTAGSLSGTDFQKSEYWQGFNLGGLTIPGSISTVSLSCNHPGEISLVGLKQRSFNGPGDQVEINRIFIPQGITNSVAGWTDPVTLLPADVRIGSYAEPIQLGGTVTPTRIVCDTNTTCNTLKVWNNSRVTINNNAKMSVLLPNLLVAPAGELYTEPGTTIELGPGVNIIGLDNATICLSGTEKLSYTFLSSEAAVGSISFNTTNSIASWNNGDTLLLVGPSASPTPETLFFNAAITNTQFGTTAASTALHYGINSSPHNIFGNFLGAPVCNITRDMNVRGGGAALRTEKLCNLTAVNVKFSNTGPGAGLTNAPASISINSNNAVIKNNVIASSSGGGIFVNNLTAYNFIINNNIIFGCTGYGIRVPFKPFELRPNISSISNNVVLGCGNGVGISHTNNIKINNNIVAACGGDGYHFNVSEIGSTTIRCSAYEIDGNVSFANVNGMKTGNIAGYITNTTCQSNLSSGVISFSTDEKMPVALSAIKSAFNGTVGVALTATPSSARCKLSSFNIQTHNNKKGILLQNCYGTLSTVAITGNQEQSAIVQDCSSEILSLYNFNISGNGISMQYTYPSTSGFNFFSTFLNSGNIKEGLIDNTCITLVNTKCERFVVNNTTFASTGPNISLAPSPNSLIEGSYLFNKCSFTAPAFDDITSKYQQKIANETGFSSMYENNSETTHKKYTVAGKVESDPSTLKFVENVMSEKLTPNSNEIRLKSSKKIINIDNFNTFIPPTLEPEYLYVSVWVKKDDNWGSNSNPRLIVSCNPTLHINNPVYEFVDDVVIAEHSSTTTDWVQLTSLSPIASAIDTRGTVEVYVDCLGTSGGSINIDGWSHTIIN